MKTVELENEVERGAVKVVGLGGASVVWLLGSRLVLRHYGSPTKPQTVEIDLPRGVRGPDVLAACPGSNGALMLATRDGRAFLWSAAHDRWLVNGDAPKSPR